MINLGFGGPGHMDRGEGNISIYRGLAAAHNIVAEAEAELVTLLLCGDRRRN